MPLAPKDISAASVVPPFEVTRSRNVDNDSGLCSASRAAPRKVSTVSWRAERASKPRFSAAASIASRK
jgi:hypothetical protein